MSQRGLPRISPADLREHATADRIERVWDRLEADLDTAENGSQLKGRFWLGLVAAALTAFGAGMLLGHQTWRLPHPPSPTAAAERTVDPSPQQEVFAAGSRPRSFALPGGGLLVLAPGTTVELLHYEPQRLELQLLQGEATLNTTEGPAPEKVSIVAGETTLSAQGPSQLHVRRNIDNVDVSVAQGLVDIASPAGTRQLHQGERAEALPIALPTSSAMPPVLPAPIASLRSGLRDSPHFDSPSPAMPTPDWRARNAAGDTSEALRLLREQPHGINGAIASAQSASELMDLHDVVVASDGAAAVRALTRIVEAFPSDPYAQIAAFKLGNIYKKMGQADKAQLYFERAQSFQGALAEDALCKRLRTAVNREEAQRAAQEYTAKYPDGRCKDDAERILHGDDPSAEDEPAAEDSPAPTQP